MVVARWPTTSQGCPHAIPSTPAHDGSVPTRKGTPCGAGEKCARKMLVKPPRSRLSEPGLEDKRPSLILSPRSVI